MIDEAKLKKAFAKVKEEFNEIKWEINKINDRLDDMSRGNDSNNDKPVLEKPLIEDVSEVKKVKKEKFMDDEEEFY